MRLDHLIVRLSAILGAEWLQAYVLIDLQPEVDVEQFRFALPRRLKYHHETEKYVGGFPGDLFVGFFARGQTELTEQVSAIRAIKEVKTIREWAIADFPVQNAEMTRLDWRVVKSLRQDSGKTAATIAAELGESTGPVSERLARLRSLPLAFSIEPPNKEPWVFTELHLDFIGTTFKERRGELLEVGKPFAMAASGLGAALMVQPTTLAELTELIKKTSAIPGVRVARYAFCEDMLWTQPWLDDFIEARIADAPRR